MGQGEKRVSVCLFVAAERTEIPYMGPRHRSSTCASRPRAGPAMPAPAAHGVTAQTTKAAASPRPQGAPISARAQAVLVLPLDMDQMATRIQARQRGKVSWQQTSKLLIRTRENGSAPPSAMPTPRRRALLSKADRAALETALSKALRLPPADRLRYVGMLLLSRFGHGLAPSPPAPTPRAAAPTRGRAAQPTHSCCQPAASDQTGQRPHSPDLQVGAQSGPCDALPDDTLRIIWQLKWRAERAAAAERLQRAMRQRQHRVKRRGMLRAHMLETMLVIDECSFINPEILHHVDLRLRALLECDVPFGGVIFIP